MDDACEPLSTGGGRTGCGRRARGSETPSDRRGRESRMTEFAGAIEVGAPCRREVAYVRRHANAGRAGVEAVGTSREGHDVVRGRGVSRASTVLRHCEQVGVLDHDHPDPREDQPSDDTSGPRHRALEVGRPRHRRSLKGRGPSVDDAPTAAVRERLPTIGPRVPRSAGCSRSPPTVPGARPARTDQLEPRLRPVGAAGLGLAATGPPRHRPDGTRPVVVLLDRGVQRPASGRRGGRARARTGRRARPSGSS